MESLLTNSQISLILLLPSAKSKIVINFPGKVLSNFQSDGGLQFKKNHQRLENILCHVIAIPYMNGINMKG